MKVKVEATELHDADVSHVSLVKNGAIRSPFKILKAEDVPAPSESFLDKVGKFFGKEDTLSTVAAVYVTGDVATYSPLIEKSGLSIANMEVLDSGITVFHQGDTPAASIGAIALGSDVLVSFDRIAKEFAPYAHTTNFMENVQSVSFLPSVGEAMNALYTTMYAVLDEVKTVPDAIGKLETTLSSFSSHVLGLAKNLPEAVFKLDSLLHPVLEGSKLNSHAVEQAADQSKEVYMKGIKEAVPGDHDGLVDAPIIKSDEPVVVAPVEVAPVVEPVVAAVAKDETAPVVAATPSDDPLVSLAASLASMSALLTGLVAKVDAQDAKIAGLATVTASVVEKAENTTRAVSWDFDESLSSANRKRPVQKAAAAESGLFDNLFSNLNL